MFALAFPTSLMLLSIAAMSVARPEAGAIPGIEGLTGEARREAMVKSAFNEDLFDRDAIAFAEVRCTCR